MSNMNIDDFENFYFNVCTLDYEKMSNAMDNLVELMNNTGKVDIIGRDTELTFSIKGIAAEKYTDTINIKNNKLTIKLKNTL